MGMTITMNSNKSDIVIPRNSRNSALWVGRVSVVGNYTRP
jgi:hypothetical protein